MLRRATELRERERRRALTVFLVLSAVGALVRVLALRTTWIQPDSDEATGMVMALRASQGHLSLLFWGGNYGGALITWVEAPLILLFGFHLAIFWVVDTILAYVAALLLWSVARRLLPPVAASAVAGTFWFFPAIWVYWSGREYVFWLPAIVFALATCVFLQRWFESRRRPDLYALGLCAGLAIWSYPLVAPLIVPGALVLLWVERRHPANIARAAVTTALGVLPWLAYFAVHGTSAFTTQTVVGSTGVNLRHTLTQVLSAALAGGQDRSDVVWSTPAPAPHVLAALGLTVYVGSVLCTIGFALARRPGLAAAGLSVVIWPFILVLGHVPIGVASFRYGLIVVAPILLLAGALLAMVRATLLLALGAVLSVLLIVLPDTSTLASAPMCNTSLVAAGRYLVATHRPVAYGSYWLASALMVCNQPELTVGSVAPVRDTVAERAAAAVPHSTYIVFAGNVLDQEIAAWTRTHHVAAVRSVAPGNYAVWTFDGRVLPATMQLNSAF